MFSPHGIQVERIEKWLSSIYWTDINIRAALFRDSQALAFDSIAVYEPKGIAEKPKFKEIIALDDSTSFASTAVGKSFGPSWFTKWFKLTVAMDEFAALCALARGSQSESRIALQWDSNSEALLYLSDGSIVQSFTGGGGNDRRDLCILSAAQCENLLSLAQATSCVTFYVEMACNGMFGNGSSGMIRPPDEQRHFTLSTARLVCLNSDAWELFWDMKVIYDVAKQLSSDDVVGARAASLGNAVINQYDPSNRAFQLIPTELRDRIRREFFLSTSPAAAPADKLDFDVYCVGHCHIDTAWLWNYDETRRKVCRSWATQLHLMDEKPDWMFVASQAVQWEWLKEDYPDLYDRVKTQVSAGRFVPVGGSYVEFDANIPSGESMIRQFLYGLEYFQSELGHSPNVFWLPDTFGYSGQLPQIMRGFGITYFLSQKLSWNLMNKFPHSTFHWEGIDGTTVLSHFPPADTYNSLANTEDILKSYKNHASKASSSKSLLLFGHGDGGGGPGMSHLENLDRLKRCKHMPRVHTNVTPSQFFEAIELEDFKQTHSSSALGPRDPLPLPPASSGVKPARWVGELYLELHQGTLTSQALTKQLNRKCEYAMKTLETLLVAAVVFAAPDSNATALKERIVRLWKTVLLNQFHDVIPGSSIGMVYCDAERLLQGVLSDAESLMTSLMDSIGEHLASRLLAPQAAHHAKLYFNPSHATRELHAGLVSTPLPSYSFALVTAGPASPTIGSDRIIGDDDSVSDVSASGKFDKPTVKLLDSGNYQLENKYIRVSINPAGQILSLVDKRIMPFREVIDCSSSNGNNRTCSGGNNLMLYDDVPFYWDAWDVFPYHIDTGHSINCDTASPSVKLIDSTEIETDYLATAFWATADGGAHTVGLEINLPNIKGSNGSSLTQRITIDESSALVSFTTSVDWKAAHKLLKVEFPLHVRAQEATYEIQNGLVSRPTHGNTPFDSAKHEVCGYRFADLSEPGYGVSLLNDCKYGYSCRGSVLCMSLLRAPKAPDAMCDMRVHTFRYGLLPHIGGSVFEGDVVRQAQLFNSPLVCHRLKEETLLSSPMALEMCHIHSPMFQAASKALVIDVIKLAEHYDNGGTAIIVRCYESSGTRGSCHITSCFDMKSVLLCDMKEEPLVPTSNLLMERSSFVAHYQPFQILTFRVEL